MVASATVAAAMLITVNALPHSRTARIAPATGPSVIAQALAKPRSPTLSLELPARLAVQIPPLRVEGVYGPARPEPTVRSYRLRDTNDLVVIALLRDVAPVMRPPDARADALSIHGQYAASFTQETTRLSSVRWTEHEITYEISSRSLVPRDLATIAEQVR